jgi:hypothetical protein
MTGDDYARFVLGWSRLGQYIRILDERLREVQ